jgi:small basic protein
VETIDQLAAILSLGVTFVVSSAMLARRLLQGLRHKEVPADSVGGLFRATIMAGALCGSVVLALLIWLVGALELREYHHHFAPFVWFVALLANLVLAVGIAFVGAIVLGRVGSPGRAP